MPSPRATTRCLFVLFRISDILFKLGVFLVLAGASLTGYGCSCPCGSTIYNSIGPCAATPVPNGACYARVAYVPMASCSWFFQTCVEPSIYIITFILFMYLRLGKSLRNVSHICFIQLGVGQHHSGLLLYKYPSDNLLPVLEQMCQGWRCWAFWGFTNGSGFLGNRWHLGCWICDVQHHHLQHGSLPASVLHHFDAKGLCKAYDPWIAVPTGTIPRWWWHEIVQKDATLNSVYILHYSKVSFVHCKVTVFYRFYKYIYIYI